MDWIPQKFCTELGEYELIVEQQQADCEPSPDFEQSAEIWNWGVAIHGTIVASGTAGNMEEAQRIAAANVPNK